MAGAAIDLLSSRVDRALAAGPRDEDDLPGVEHIAGEHPLPGANSVDAGLRALEIARAARRACHPVVVLLSGGASSMLAVPAPGLTLDDKRRTADVLMRAGATIAQLNTVRKHLSAIKGGRLATAAGRCTTLLVSDVHDPQDDPAIIGSGPTVADPTTYADALKVFEDLRATAPARVRQHLEAGAAGAQTETPKVHELEPGASLWEVIANRRTAMDGAADEARRLGYYVHTINAATHGEARDAGRVFAEVAMAALPPAGAACIIGSGETIVTVRGRGRGGRNQEFVLGAAPVLADHSGAVLIVSVGTDGIDGPTDAAGAVADSTTVVRAGDRAVRRALEANDAYPLLARLGDLVKWGSTFTNVGDLHILITMGG